MLPLPLVLKKIRPTSGRRPEGGLTSFLFQFCMFQRKKLASQVFQKKNIQILSKEGHDFPYKFQQILEKVENDREQFLFISEENNYSKRSYGLFRSESSLIMTSVQDSSQILFLGSNSEGGAYLPPADQNRGYKRPDQNRVKSKSVHTLFYSLRNISINVSCNSRIFKHLGLYTRSS